MVGGRAAGQAQPYLGLEEDMPRDTTYTEIRYFNFTVAERSDMTNGGVEWADTRTFDQASRWIFGQDTDDQIARATQKSTEKVVALPSPATSGKTAAKKRDEMWKAYKEHMQRKAGSGAREIHLVWGFGSNSAPPFRGTVPLLFDTWTNEEKPLEGAKLYCLSHGDTKYRKFGPFEGKTATEWVEFFIGGSEFAAWNGTRPQWFKEPDAYRSPKLKLDLFEVAQGPGADEFSGLVAQSSSSMGRVAVGEAQSLMLTFTQPTYLETVSAPDPNRPLLLSPGPHPASAMTRSSDESEDKETLEYGARGEKDEPDERQAPSQEGAGEDSALERKEAGGDAPPQLKGDGSEPGRMIMGGADDPLTKKTDGAEAGSTVQAPGAPGGGQGRFADTPVVDLTCVCCGKDVDTTLPNSYATCTAKKGTTHCLHLSCMQLVQSKGLVVTNQWNKYKCNCFEELAGQQDLMCGFSAADILGKITKQASDLENEKITQKQRRADADMVAAKALLLSANCSGDSGGKAVPKPPPLPTVDTKAMVVMTFSGYRLNPGLSTAEKADKAQRFISFMTEAKIPALHAWIGPTGKGDVVPVYLVLGRAFLDDGQPNMEVIWPAVLLLSSQAREAGEACYDALVKNDGDRDGGKHYKGWAPAGKEGLVARESGKAINFDPIRVVVQLEQTQANLNTCPPFTVGDSAMGRYVTAKTCPVQAIIDRAFPRLLDEVFTSDFDKEEARQAREEQRQKEKRERDEKSAPDQHDAGPGPAKTSKLSGRTSVSQHPGLRGGPRGGGIPPGAGRGLSPPSRDSRDASGNFRRPNDGRHQDGSNRREHDDRSREGGSRRETPGATTHQFNYM